MTENSMLPSIKFVTTLKSSGQRQTLSDAPTPGIGRLMEEQRVSPAYPYKTPRVMMPSWAGGSSKRK